MALSKLNFPDIEVRFQNNQKGTLQVFDVIRKKFVDLTPEEWVRQHIIHYLMLHKQVPASMISVEKLLKLNTTKKRTDLVVFNSTLQPVLLIECKAPSVELNQQTINQIMRYNLQLNVPHVFISNGQNHICLSLKNNEPTLLTDLPNYTGLL